MKPDPAENEAVIKQQNEKIEQVMKMLAENQLKEKSIKEMEARREQEAR